MYMLIGFYFFYNVIVNVARAASCPPLLYSVILHINKTQLLKLFFFRCLYVYHKSIRSSTIATKTQGTAQDRGRVQNVRKTRRAAGR